ncbi:MAG TPA: DNA-directed RNA polymerase subunit omega [Alphaproteobacteria bacterium]|nr:DNA-directed RNA polymerase subunit omega [Alphaproteobacteria bacterium]
MARVTVEDCVTIIPNRFELVMMAAQRCRIVTGGAAITVPKDNDKLPVIALREVAAKTINLDDIKEDLIKSYQRVIETPEDDADLDEFMTGEEGYMPPIYEETAEFAQLVQAAMEDELDDAADEGEEQPDVVFPEESEDE